MSTLAFGVTDWVWCTSESDLHCAGNSGVPERSGPVLSLPGAERRRLNPLASFTLRVAERLASGRPHGLLQATPLVFGSADGDGAVLLRLLSALRDHQPVSPTQFHNSVHNAPAGYWSIGLASQAPTTALAADEDTIEVALVEAGMQAVARRGPVVMLTSGRCYPPELRRARPELRDFALAAWCEPPDEACGWRCELACPIPSSPMGSLPLEASIRAHGENGLVGSRTVRHLAGVLTITRTSG